MSLTTITTSYKPTVYINGEQTVLADYHIAKSIYNLTPQARAAAAHLASIKSVPQKPTPPSYLLSHADISSLPYSLPSSSSSSSTPQSPFPPSPPDPNVCSRLALLFTITVLFAISSYIWGVQISVGPTFIIAGIVVKLWNLADPVQCRVLPAIECPKPKDDWLGLSRPRPLVVRRFVPHKPGMSAIELADLRGRWVRVE